MPTPFFRIRVAMALGFLIGALFGVWGSWLEILVTGGLTAIAFGLAMVAHLALQARKRRRNRHVIREPLSHVRIS